MLVRSIISQQISTSAARSIRRRLQDLIAPEPVRPETLVRYSPEELRTAGISPQKAGYLLDLAGKVHDGDVRLNQLGRHGDERVIEELTKIKGIGRWTAQMFLMFALGRMDVFPVDDLGIRNGIRDLYGYDEAPAAKDCHDLGEAWKPYRSIASWYLWRSLDNDAGTDPNAGYPT